MIRIKLRSTIVYWVFISLRCKSLRVLIISKGVAILMVGALSIGRGVSSRWLVGEILLLYWSHILLVLVGHLSLSLIIGHLLLVSRLKLWRGCIRNWPPAGNCLNLLHLQVFNRFFPGLVTEPLVLFIHIQY